nr:MAG TPA: hypothetical protein [Caudoviricetes sp.]
MLVQCNKTNPYRHHFYFFLYSSCDLSEKVTTSLFFI